MTGALSHLRAVDASNGVAGQYCGRLLSDYGAETTLLEPEGGTWTRRAGPFGAGGRSLLFRHLNLGKQVETAGAGRLAALTAEADIAILPAGADHAALRQTNPMLVTCTVSDFGEDGPRAGWKGGELIHQALSGVMYRNGDPARAPLYGSGWRAHYVTGVAAYAAVLAAILARGRTGRGQHVAIDVAECAASMTYALGTQYNYNGVREYRTTPANLPSTTLRCRDAWVAVFIYAYRWRDTCAALGVPELADDPRCATTEERMRNWPAVVDVFRQAVRDLPADAVVDRLQSLGCVAGRAVRPSELRDMPHLLARGYWEEAEGGPMLGPPFRMEKTPRVLPKAAARRRAS